MTTAEMIQSATSIAALVISLVTVFQQITIKGLKKAVKQLKKQTAEMKIQTGTLIQQYELDKLLSRANRFPVFEQAAGLEKTDEQLRYTCSLKNIGVKAFKIRVHIVNPDFVVTRTGYDVYTDVGYGENINFQIVCIKRDLWSTALFDFEIHFQNNYGIHTFQRIKQTTDHKDYEILFPVDVVV